MCVDLLFQRTAWAAVSAVAWKGLGQGQGDQSGDTYNSPGGRQWCCDQAARWRMGEAPREKPEYGSMVTGEGSD